MSFEYTVPDLEELKVEYRVEDPTLSTTAEISRYYPEIKQSWETGEQQATADGIPLSREYRTLSFTNSEATNLDLVQLGYYSDEYEGDKYYRVTSKFNETEYYSARDGGYDNFLRWELSENEFLQEIIYKHEKVSELLWNRPVIQSANNGIPPLVIASSTTSTGVGLPIQQALGVQVQWSALDIPYKRTVEAGEALGAIVTTDGNAEIRLKSTLDGSGTLYTKGQLIVLDKRYIEIKFNTPTQYLPTYVKVEFYGKELWRSFAPIKIDDEPEILVHPLSASQEQRYKPPGRSDLPDNFWNNKPLNETNYQDFSNRQGANSRWL